MKFKKLLIAVFAALATMCVFVGCSDTTVSGNHVLTKVEAKAATCVAEGNTEYYTCSHCDKLFADSKASKIVTLGEVTLAATGVHNTDGRFDCADCGVEIFENEFFLELLSSFSTELGGASFSVNAGEVAIEGEVVINNGFYVSAEITQVIDMEEQTMVIKAVAEEPFDGTVYATMNNVTLGETANIYLPLSKILAMFGGAVEGQPTPDGGIATLDVAPEGEAEAAFEVVKGIVKTLFRPVKTASGYELTFTLDTVEYYVNFIGTTKIPALVDMVAGKEGTFEEIEKVLLVKLPDLLCETTIGEIVEELELTLGVTVVDLYTQLNQVIAQANIPDITCIEDLIGLVANVEIPSLLTFIGEDSPVMGWTVAEAIGAITSEGGAETDVPTAAFTAEKVLATIKTVFGTLKNNSIFEFIATQNGMAVTEIQKEVAETFDMLEQFCSFSIFTENDGTFVEAGLQIMQGAVLDLTLESNYESTVDYTTVVPAVNKYAKLDLIDQNGNIVKAKLAQVEGYTFTEVEGVIVSGQFEGTIVTEVPDQTDPTIVNYVPVDVVYEVDLTKLNEKIVMAIVYQDEEGQDVVGFVMVLPVKCSYEVDGVTVETFGLLNVTVNENGLYSLGFQPMMQ